MSIDRSHTSRRQVLCGLAAALAVPAALAACSSGESSPAPAGGSGGDSGGGGGAGSAPPASPNGTPLSQIPVGGGTVVEGASGPVVIVQPTAGTVRAFSAVCPHQGTTVNAPAGGTITCPKHGSQFDPGTGSVKKGPAKSGLSEVPARVQNGSVVLS